MTLLSNIKIPKRNGTPSTPASGFVKIYVKISDGKMYILNDAGVEEEIGSVSPDASETVKGITEYSNPTELDTAVDAVENNRNNNTATTPRGVRQIIDRFLATVKVIFGIAPRISTSSGSRIQWTNSSKDIADATVRNGLSLDASGNLELGGALTKNTSITSTNRSFTFQMGDYFLVVDSDEIQLGNSEFFLAFRSINGIDPPEYYINDLRLGVAKKGLRLLYSLDNIADDSVITKKYVTDNFPLLVGGKIQAIHLPSYVDDVLEYANLAAFPVTGESGKLYVALDTNLVYRWTGSTYATTSSSLALGETSSTAYRGDRGKAAYDHSQLTGNPHGTIISEISGLQTALDAKLALAGGSLTGALNFAKAVDLASSATTNIASIAGNYVNITGAVTITALGNGAQAGAIRFVRFTGTLVLTHNSTSLILPAGQNITTTAGDVATFISEGSNNWRCISYFRANLLIQYTDQKDQASGYTGKDANRQIVINRTSIASASTLNLDATSGNVIEVTGVTTVNNIEAPIQTTFLVLIPKGVFLITQTGNIRLKGGLVLETTVDEPIFFIWDSTGNYWSQINFVTKQTKQSLNPTWGIDFIENSTAGLVPFTANFFGSASLTYSKRADGRVGIGTLNRGTASATDRARWGLGGSGGVLDLFTFGAGVGYWCNGAVRIPTLSDATNRFNLQFGFTDVVTTLNGNNMVSFVYSDNINSGRFQFRCRKAGADTQLIDTGITVVAGTWYDLYIEVSKDGATARGYIDGVLVATVTTTANLPNGSGQRQGFIYNLLGVLGTANVELDSDYLYADKIV